MTRLPDSMEIVVRQELPSALDEYARISIAFEMRSVLDVERASSEGQGFVLSEQPLPAPMLKDYDAISGEGPASWPGRFDMSKWMVFAAYAGEVRVGGAAVVMNSSEINLLEGRSDLALLWDLRVASAARRHGVGSDLMNGVETWASNRGARTVKVETQNTNVPACRFYARHGFQLLDANARVYPEFPQETQFLWYKNLVPPRKLSTALPF